MDDRSAGHEGGCTCGAVRFRMTSRPLVVNCCHCRWCQRETGSAFVINAMIEADRVELVQGDVVVVRTPSASGNAPPDSDVPAPRGTTLMPSSLQYRSTAATCATVDGSTTINGGWR